MRFRRPDRAELDRLGQEARHARAKRRQPAARYTRAFVRHFGAQVRDGPFAGMVYTRRGVALAEDVVAKLLGAYEGELSDVVEEGIRLRPEVIVVVGAGEGYYAVGLARRCPAAAVVAFESDPLRQWWCAKMAGANGVGTRVHIRGEADAPPLEQSIAGRPAFVICDCEGAESTVIDPAHAPSLGHALLVVEVHDFVDAGIAPVLERALEPTHDLEWILAQPRWRDDFPALAEVPGSDYMDHDLALLEFRPRRMRWLVARPRVTSGQSAPAANVSHRPGSPAE